MAADIFVNNSNNQHTAPGTNIFQLRSEALLVIFSPSAFLSDSDDRHGIPQIALISDAFHLSSIGLRWIVRVRQLPA